MSSDMNASILLNRAVDWQIPEIRRVLSPVLLAFALVEPTGRSFQAYFEWVSKEGLHVTQCKHSTISTHRWPIITHPLSIPRISLTQEENWQSLNCLAAPRGGKTCGAAHITVSRMVLRYIDNKGYQPMFQYHTRPKNNSCRSSSVH